MADLAQVEPAVIEAQNGLTLYCTRMTLWYSSNYPLVLVEKQSLLKKLEGF